MSGNDKRRVPNVVGLGGSLRGGSATAFALQVALKGAAAAGAETTFLDLRQLELPLYRDGITAPELPEPAVTLLEAVRKSDAIIFATPVYHATPSGAIKNAIDYLELLADDDPPWLEGKLAGLVAVSRGVSGINAINTLDYACRALHAWTLPLTVAVPGGAFEGGKLDKAVATRLVQLGYQLATKSQPYLEVPERAASRPTGA
jgi:FMN reductase